MTESAEERTKRKFLSCFDRYDWNTQISIFLVSAEDIPDALDLFQKTRKHLARKIPEDPILWRICSKGVNPSKVYSDYHGTSKTLLSPYLTIFTTKELKPNEAKSLFESLKIGTRIIIKARKLSLAKKHTYQRSIKIQKPHDLTKIFGEKKVKRFGVLNEKLKPKP